MPNQQPLPRPNFPQSADQSDQPTQSQSAQPTQVGQPTNQQSDQPADQSTQAVTQPGQPSQIPAGLDPQSPGGSPPPVDDRGQVMSASANVSGTREKPDYGQGSGQDQGSSDSDFSHQDGSGQPTAAPSGLRPPSLPSVPAAAAAARSGAGSNQTQSDQIQSVKPGQQAPIQATGQTSAGPGAQINRAQSGSPPTPGQALTSLTGRPISGQGGQASPGGERPQSRPGSNLAADAKTQSPSQSSSQTKTGKEPIFAKAKKSPLKWLPFVLGGIAVIAVVGYLITQVLGGGINSVTQDGGGETPGTGAGTPADSAGQGAGTTSETVVLSYWGLWEPSTVLQEVLADFEQQHSGVTVNYTKQSHKDYRTRLQSAIASGNGPDIFRYHATWVPMLSEELAPMPTQVMNAAEFKKSFYNIMTTQLQLNGQIVGIPLMYDGLGLYYNRDILETANEDVPKTWGELKLLADKLTVRSGDEVERGGLAIGNTSNVEHWSDILGLLIYQNGGNPSKPVSSEVRDAIKFYVSFSQSSPVFSSTLASSTAAFAREEVAMMFAPSWRAHQIEAINPDLNYGIAPVPKLSESEIGWATYWAEGVSSQSENQEQAWQLLEYLSSEPVMKKLYSQQSQVRSFGEIYSRIELADQITSEKIAAFLLDAPSAESWYLCSYTHDEGLNDDMIGYYQDAVNEVSRGGSVDDALQSLQQGVSRTLNQYGVSQAAGAGSGSTVPGGTSGL